MNELLVPLSTMFTGTCAVAAVLINNYYVSRNLTRQIKAQNEENKLKTKNEIRSSSLRDKQLKLEQLFEELSAFHEESSHHLATASNIYQKEEYNHPKKYELLQQVVKDYSKSQSFCRKAQILGYSYSDSDELFIALDALKEHDKQTKLSIQKLASLYLLSQVVLDPDDDTEAAENEYMDELHESISSMIKNIDGIEQLIIKELRECRIGT